MVPWTNFWGRMSTPLRISWVVHRSWCQMVWRIKWSQTIRKVCRPFWIGWVSWLCLTVLLQKGSSNIRKKFWNLLWFYTSLSHFQSVLLIQESHDTHLPGFVPKDVSCPPPMSSVSFDSWDRDVEFEPSPMPYDPRDFLRGTTLERFLRCRLLQWVLDTTFRDANPSKTATTATTQIFEISFLCKKCRDLPSSGCMYIYCSPF